MHFRSDNWNNLKQSSLKSTVEYIEADLDLVKSEQIIPRVPTTVVVIWDGNNRFVGVAQCGPNDEYNKSKGREIASGRAIKEYVIQRDDPERVPNEVWEHEGKEVNIFGRINADIEQNISDHMIFE